MAKDRRYSELIRFPTFEERFEYLKLSGHVGFDTFGFDRYMNQMFYQSTEWKQFRNHIIIRDNGCDLGIADRQIGGRIYIHHITPITPDDFKRGSSSLLDPENAICVSFNTHQAIHYGDKTLLTPSMPIERRANDTCPWK